MRQGNQPRKFAFSGGLMKTCFLFRGQTEIDRIVKYMDL